MTPLSIWDDSLFWALMVMPIGGGLIGLFCWIFLFPKQEKSDGEHSRR